MSSTLGVFRQNAAAAADSDGPLSEFSSRAGSHLLTYFAVVFAKLTTNDVAPNFVGERKAFHRLQSGWFYDTIVDLSDFIR